MSALGMNRYRSAPFTCFPTSMDRNNNQPRVGTEVVGRFCKWADNLCDSAQGFLNLVTKYEVTSETICYSCASSWRSGSRFCFADLPFLLIMSGLFGARSFSSPLLTWMLASMTHLKLAPDWAKLFKVTEVIRLDEADTSPRSWHQYILESENSKIVGKSFGRPKEIWNHANDRVRCLNERLAGNRPKTQYLRKSKWSLVICSVSCSRTIRKLILWGMIQNTRKLCFRTSRRLPKHDLRMWPK